MHFFVKKKKDLAPTIRMKCVVKNVVQRPCIALYCTSFYQRSRVIFVGQPIRREILSLQSRWNKCNDIVYMSWKCKLIKNVWIDSKDMPCTLLSPALRIQWIMKKQSINSLSSSHIITHGQWVKLKWFIS